MHEAIFVLCAVTSAGCAALLLRAWLANRSRLVFGTLMCFVGLVTTNLLVMIDVIVLHDQRLEWRGIPAVLGLATLAYVMITAEG